MKSLNLFPAGIIIEIIGNVASGKTTTTKKISHITSLEYIDIDVYERNPYLPLYVEDPKRWTFTSDLYFSYIRSQQIAKIAKLMEYAPIALDSSLNMGIYVYSKNCYLQGKMTEDEWMFLQKLHSTLIHKHPPIHATIFIDVSIDTIMKRIVARGREHEQEYSRKYVSELNERLKEYKQDLIALKQRKIVATYHQLEKRLEFHTKEDKKLQKLFTLLESNS